MHIYSPVQLVYGRNILVDTATSADWDQIKLKKKKKKKKKKNELEKATNGKIQAKLITLTNQETRY